MRRTRAALLVLAVAIAAAALAGLGFELLNTAGQQQDDTNRRYRWLSVEVTLPESVVEYEVLRTPPFSPENDQYLIQISPLRSQAEAAAAPAAAHPELRINAENGEILHDTLSSDYSADAAAIIESIEVLLEAPEVWPYEGDPPKGRTAESGSITYVEPEPSSGILIGEERGQCAEPECGASAVLIVNDGRSLLRIDGETGEADWSGVQPQAQDAFERFVEEVRVAHR